MGSKNPLKPNTGNFDLADDWPRIVSGHQMQAMLRRAAIQFRPAGDKFVNRRQRLRRTAITETRHLGVTENDPDQQPSLKSGR